MPFNNFEARHFTNEEQTSVTDALTALEAALNSKFANLTPDERKQFGSVNEQNKLVINKVKEYRDTQPQLSSPDVDWDEFARDFNSRNFIATILQRFDALYMGLKNAKILHDWDNYQATLTDYNYTKYKNSTAATGFEAKQTDLAQFFSNRGNSNTTTVAESPTEEPTTPEE
ncbi:hypothetical protein [Tenacibaculum amylolyticum]|uniref:hypothetical protein n=1 Tax=Tenacibaculum amylolyticum TaxID=104269 RepID=UPI003895A063